MTTRLHHFWSLAMAVVCSAATTLLHAESTPDRPLKDAKDGVSVNAPEAQQGYTLIAPMNSTSTYLIDMAGHVVNEWKSEYTPALSSYLLPNGHLLRPAAERRGGFGGPGGGGRIQEFDWDGNLVWDFVFQHDKLRPHHDICPLPNGNVLVVASDPKTAAEETAVGRRAELVTEELLPDCLLEIKPTGKTTGEIVWQWHAWDHLVQDVDPNLPNYGDVSENPQRIDINFSTAMMDRMLQDPAQLARLRSLGYVGGGAPRGEPDQAGTPGSRGGQRPEGRDGNRGRNDRRGGPGGGGDWMHVNAVAYNAKLDQIMLSVHEFSEVWIIDHGTTTAEAASNQGGKRGHGGDLLYRWGNPRVYRSGTNVDQRLFAQHCAHWIAEGLPGAGNMLVFNNGMGRPDGSYSTSDEIELPLKNDGTYEKEEYLPYGPLSAKWSYSAPEKSDFFSMLISGTQRQPNGNTLICSGNQAMLFEVTPNNEIVWVLQLPGGGMGGPGGRGGPGGPGEREFVPTFLARVLGLSESQLKTIAELQKNIDEKLAKVLTKEQLEKLKSPGGGGPGFGGPPRIGEVVPVSLVADLSEEQFAQVKTLQDEVDEALKKVWTAEQKKNLDELESRMGGGPGAGRPGFGGPGGFGPPPGMGGPGGPDGRDRGPDRRGAGGPFGRGGPFGPGGGPGGPDGGPGGRGPGGGGPGGPGGVFRAYRYDTEYTAFEGKDLKPGKLLVEAMTSAGGPGQQGPPRP
ncbi:aryl-sulfate sulfotransferase [Bremerella sp. JC817]|uniref:aryl-sulfate sulfotransferase n=1 Tax=Bremerella sp. JC817 TaxID=3231756 RepID=UPI003459F5EF